jgi:hypothetical protein
MTIPHQPLELPSARRLGYLAVVLLAFTSVVHGISLPPNPRASCASAEYAAIEAQRAIDGSNPSAPSGPDLMVVLGSSPLNTTKQITMGQQVTVCIMGLYNWIYVQKKNPANLRLFIGGSMLENIPPSAVSPTGQEYLNFMLQMDNADSKDWKAWASIIYASRHSKDHQLPISIAISDTKEVLESNAVVAIAPYPNSWPYLLILLLVLLGCLVYLGYKSDLLRSAVGLYPSRPDRAPYSLALFQMAFWFYLVLAAYVYILVSTRQIHINMGSVLGLLGISATTGLAAVAVDKQKFSSARDQRNSLTAEKTALTKRMEELKTSGAGAGTPEAKELAERQTRLTELNAAITLLPPPPIAPTSHGLVQDLLNDGDGVSFHRFQIAIWTIVLGGVFIWEVYRNMSMPDFDASLLSLMGISAGTYVGFKVPEKPKP